MSVRAWIACGGGGREPRSDCPDPLHDYPMPTGYNAAFEVANRRLSKGWGNPKCRQCGLYGWTRGRDTNDGYDERVPATTKETTP